ncbi:hypothetical protein [Candidatus Magnetominusculus dajiuhuensis]|uniref:hypothetical protein n=1 Tax=Candidatus Magnetominusculus dajiuhuensis TaxID=3137712 RepID=UPI003B438AD2
MNTVDKKGVEVDNVKSVDAQMPRLQVVAFSYKKEDLNTRIPLKLQEKEYIAYLESIIKMYPFLVVTGLRVLTEIKIKESLDSKNIKYYENIRRFIAYSVRKILSTHRNIEYSI